MVDPNTVKPRCLPGARANKSVQDGCLITGFKCLLGTTFIAQQTFSVTNSHTLDDVPCRRPGCGFFSPTTEFAAGPRPESTLTQHRSKEWTRRASRIPHSHNHSALAKARGVLRSDGWNHRMPWAKPLLQPQPRRIPDYVPVVIFRTPAHHGDANFLKGRVGAGRPLFSRHHNFGRDLWPTHHLGFDDGGRRCQIIQYLGRRSWHFFVRAVSARRPSHSDWPTQWCTWVPRSCWWTAPHAGTRPVW